MPESTRKSPPSTWAEAAQWIEANLGLYFPPRLWPDLQRGLQAAARRLDLADAAACLQRAASGRLDAQEQQVLAECLTIRETYFFRDPAMYAQLARHVLLPLIAERRSGTRSLRLWSAGCSSGEEPYSLAMLLAGLLPDWREWDLSILATDISTAALQKGRAGAYGAWSLRGGVAPEVLSFLHDGNDGRKHVDAELRRLVRFERLNLAADAYPSPATGTTGMDLVLCRNVLIYFEPARAASILARLGRALAPEGWLVTTSVELPARGVEGLRLVQADELFALRRADAADSTARPAPRPATSSTQRPAVIVPPLPPAPALPATEPAPESAVASASPADESAAPSAAGLLDRARQRADGGDLAEAEHLCREAMACDKLDPEAAYLLGSILSEAGCTGEAMAALQRALYLAPDHLLARFALGSLCLARGDEPAGHRHLARALAQLARMPAREVLPGGGGLTAGELEGAIRRMEAHVP
jgi:chemotaxis protein methyltransferase CheR